MNMNINLDIKVPSFLSGMSRILDLGCTYNNSVILDPKSDYKAMKSDWENVGLDLRNSIHKWNSD